MYFWQVYDKWQYISSDSNFSEKENKNSAGLPGMGIQNRKAEVVPTSVTRGHFGLFHLPLILYVLPHSIPSSSHAEGVYISTLSAEQM